MTEGIRIAMWSGPRNISTAMMYSFDNRPDCYATDEPLYANFLKNTEIEHPDAEKVIECYDTNLDSIVDRLTGPIPDGKQIWYQKHMCHHVERDSELSWIDGLSNCFLIRDPREVLLSLSKITDVVDLWVTGLPQQMRILGHVVDKTGENPPIIDARDILENPVGVLSSLCEIIGIRFREEMVSWKPGPRDCDGIWAKHWYSSVWKSSGFSLPHPREGQLKREYLNILGEAEEMYDELWSRRLGA